MGGELMFNRTQFWLTVACVGVIIASIVSFAKQQQRIGAMRVLVKQEQQTRDSLKTVITAQVETLIVVRAGAARADSAAERATRRALVAERRWAEHVHEIDSVYTDTPDTALVPLAELIALRDAGVRAVNACVASRDSVRAYADSLETQCELERRRADTEALARESAERELALVQRTPASPKGRWDFWKGAGVGAVAVAVLKVLGVLRF